MNWIATKDQLPEVGHDYLVYTDNGHGDKLCAVLSYKRSLWSKFNTDGVWYEYNYKSDRFNEFPYEVIYWMLLPFGPTGGEINED